MKKKPKRPLRSSLPRHMYAYGSIRTGYTKTELNKNMNKTKVYVEYLDMINKLKGMFFPVTEEDINSLEELVSESMNFDAERHIQFDVMTSAREGMHFKLEQIIAQSKPDDTVLVINSLNVFGSCESIQKYYRICRKKKIGILYPDYTREAGLSEFSTYGYDFGPREQSEYDRAFDLVYRLEEKDIQDNRGRMAGKPSRTFRVAFWLYELFKIPEAMAVSMSGYSKNGFHMAGERYEQTIEYKEELLIMEKEFGISELIKRNRPVPEHFDKLIHWYEKKGSLELACIHCKVPMIFPIDYKRLLLKHKGGRKEVARCLKFYDTELIIRFEQWVEKGKPATEFYSTCDMEKYLSRLENEKQ